MPTAAKHRYQAPKGTRDFLPEELAVRRYIERVWRDVSVCHGFDEIDVPTFEHLELYTDPANGLGSFFPIDVLPASFMIDRQGRVVSVLRSYVDWDDPAAAEMIRALAGSSAAH